LTGTYPSRGDNLLVRRAPSTRNERKASYYPGKFTRRRQSISSFHLC